MAALPEASFSRGSPAIRELTAVDSLDISVVGGVSDRGPGCGRKDHLSAHAGGDHGATSGEGRVAGCDLNTNPEGIRNHLAYMSQRFGLYPDLTVRENINFYADLYGVPRPERRNRMGELLDFSRMSPFTGRRAGDLSGGMKQKLQLICALIHTPRVLLLDEPTNGVDPVSRREFWRILHRLLQQDVAI
jgi:ABC-2 type transport system ATP-binding protein